jgi:hypothetical protein
MSKAAIKKIKKATKKNRVTSNFVANKIKKRASLAKKAIVKKNAPRKVAVQMSG